MIAEVAYFVCMLTSILCAVLLVRRYRATRAPLLLWSSLCFVGLALNNVLLFTDLFVIPDTNLELWRSSTALGALLLLLYGMIWEVR
jgi:hypothetical protein